MPPDYRRVTPADLRRLQTRSDKYEDLTTDELAVLNLYFTTELADHVIQAVNAAGLDLAILPAFKRCWHTGIMLIKPDRDLEVQRLGYLLMLQAAVETPDRMQRMGEYFVEKLNHEPKGMDRLARVIDGLLNEAVHHE